MKHFLFYARNFTDSDLMFKVFNAFPPDLFSMDVCGGREGACFCSFSLERLGY